MRNLHGVWCLSDDSILSMFVTVCLLSMCFTLFYCHFVSFLLSVCSCVPWKLHCLWHHVLFLPFFNVKMFILAYFSKVVYVFIAFVICLLSVSLWCILLDVVFHWYWIALTCLIVMVIVCPVFITLMLKLYPLWSSDPGPTTVTCVHGSLSSHCTVQFTL